MRWAVLILVLGLSACAKDVDKTVPSAVAVDKEKELVLTFNRAGTHAKDLIHNLAARCWLDGVVRGANLIVTPFNGGIEIVGDTATLLKGRFLHSEGPAARLRLTGSAIANPEMVAKLKSTLQIAVKTGETRCPRAV